MISHSHKYLAEALGTFLLALAVSLSVSQQFAIPTFIVAGFTLMLCVYTLGSISGCHINPAVTIGLLSVKKIGLQDGILYVLSQCIGGVAALYVMTAIHGGPLQASTETFSVGIFLMEAMGAFILLFGVASVVYGKVHSAAAGVVIGGSLSLGALLASTVSGGILNPAVAIALSAFTPLYIVAPIVGGIAGAWTYKTLVKA